MNESYEQIEIIRGKQYRYDPDMDAWYPRPPPEGPVSKWAWIVLCMVLAVCAWCIEYHPGLV